MTTAVIELNSLPDAIRPRAQDHDLRAIGRLGFVLFFVRRIKVWRIRFEFSSAGIDALINRNQAKILAKGADLAFTAFRQISETAIRQSGFFEGAEEIERNVFKRRRAVWSTRRRGCY